MFRIASFLLIAAAAIFSANAATITTVTTSDGCLGSNEIYSTCGKLCDTTCPISNVKTTCTVTSCVPGCICQDGYSRLSVATPTCVSSTSCPSITTTASLPSLSSVIPSVSSVIPAISSVLPSIPIPAPSTSSIPISIPIPVPSLNPINIPIPLPIPKGTVGK